VRGQKGTGGSDDKGGISRGLFAEDSFDRVYVDGENPKRFRESAFRFPA